MELLLNTVWALVAGLAIVGFLGSAPARRKEFLLALGALCCALLLLFPAISVSDDLHLEAVLTEDCNAGKRLANAAHLTNAEFTAVLLVLGAQVTNLFRVIGFVRVAAAVPHLSALLERPVLGRAPPLSSAA